MLSAIRKRITPGTVIATLALVFAMTGGALAAKKYLITSTKQISPSVLKSLKGANGAAGAAGSQGAQGPAGPAGSAGGKGETGAAGKEGAQGKEGPQGKAGATGAKGTNGTNGTTGFTETLPSGETETGAWAFGEVAAGAVPANFVKDPISFNIPLPTALTGTGCKTNPPAATCHVHYINAEDKEVVNLTPLEEIPSADCKGSASAPTAAPGNLCVYTGAIELASLQNIFIQAPDGVGVTGASTSGAMLSFSNVSEEAVGWGTWAVTAE